MTSLEDRYLREYGEVLTFGSGDCGQLAHGMEEDEDLMVKYPRVVHSLRLVSAILVGIGQLQPKLAPYTNRGHQMLTKSTPNLFLYIFLVQKQERDWYLLRWHPQCGVYGDRPGVHVGMRRRRFSGQVKCNIYCCCSSIAKFNTFNF